MIMILTLMEESKRIFSEKPHVAEKNYMMQLMLPERGLKKYAVQLLALLQKS